MKLGADEADNMLVIEVALFQEDGFWIAQGITLDYCAYGLTEEQAQQNFLTGLSETASENMREFGHLRHFLRPAPVEIQQRMLEAAFAGEAPVSARRDLPRVDLPLLAPPPQISFRHTAAA